MWTQIWFCRPREPASKSSGVWGHLEAIKADEVGLLGVVLHEAHSPAMFHGPMLGSRRQRQVQLNNCGGQRLGKESRINGVCSWEARVS
jgi:hypothetical protein